MRKQMRMHGKLIKMKHDEIAARHKEIEMNEKAIQALQDSIAMTKDFMTLFTPSCGYNRIFHECAVRTASLL